MKDDHLTLRLPHQLAQALARWARERGVPKSQLAREAVVRYLSLTSPSAPPSLRVTAAELAERWALLPRLTPREAGALAADLKAAARALPRIKSPWG
jgi:hypothetical protein